VEPAYEKSWGDILQKASIPPPFTRLHVYDKDIGIPRGNYGVIITETPWEEPENPGTGPVVYPIGSSRREYRGATVLAFNPWMVFRKYQEPLLTRERVENPAGGQGVLILPGGEREAVYAWLDQFLQERPGVFSGERETWETAEEILFRGWRFQRGAPTYTWLDVWILFFKEESAWVYAPMNRVRELPIYQASGLDATPFPPKGDWTEYGLQADVLWAIPGGNEKQLKKLADTVRWLETAEIQTTIADIIRWIPAHPEGKPIDTIAREAQVAWFSSSFIWQGAKNVQESAK
jgi:hypothetical protein